MPSSQAVGRKPKHEMTKWGIHYKSEESSCSISLMAE